MKNAERNSFQMILLLDFAETLAFRPKKEIEVDIDLICQSSGISRKYIKNEYKKFCIEKKWFELFPKYYDSINKELADYQNHFNQFMDYSNIDFDANEIAKNKIYSNQHQLFNGVERFLIKAKDNFEQIIVVSEGRPSRQINILNLNINSYIDKLIISDIEGFGKDIIIKKIRTYLNQRYSDAEIFFVDDQLVFANYCDDRIKFFLISRDSTASIDCDIKKIKELNEIFKYCDLPTKG